MLDVLDKELGKRGHPFVRDGARGYGGDRVSNSLGFRFITGKPIKRRLVRRSPPVEDESTRSDGPGRRAYFELAKPLHCCANFKRGGGCAPSPGSSGRTARFAELTSRGVILRQTARRFSNSPALAITFPNAAFGALGCYPSCSASHQSTEPPYSDRYSRRRARGKRRETFLILNWVNCDFRRGRPRDFSRNGSFFALNEGSSVATEIVLLTIGVSLIEEIGIALEPDHAAKRSR
jgi:hypothetical protein